MFHNQVKKSPKMILKTKTFMKERKVKLLDSQN